MFDPEPDETEQAHPLFSMVDALWETSTYHAPILDRWPAIHRAISERSPTDTLCLAVNLLIISHLVPAISEAGHDRLAEALSIHQITDIETSRNAAWATGVIAKELAARGPGTSLDNALLGLVAIAGGLHAVLVSPDKERSFSMRIAQDMVNVITVLGHEPMVLLDELISKKQA